MAKIVVNKNFNQKYLYRYAQAMFRTTSTTNTPSIKDDDSLNNQMWETFDLPFITNESTLNTLEKISRHYNDIEVDNVTRWNDLGEVIMTILCNNDIYVSNALLGLVTEGIITQSEADSMLIKGLETELVLNTLVDVNGLMLIESTLPSKLKERFDASLDNPLSEQLYICFTTGHSHRFNGINESMDSIDYNYLSTSSELTKQAFPYVAVSIGTTGTEDVVVDYTDKIDYLDDFEIKVQLPKQVS